ncbi:ferredoxin [Lactococcus termiticola]|uniref:Ferredoxin n=1 Tax=Lactococcus termiticola TaxID=2169526 RepID=A0A2R5HHA2_9LACT|nr:ferredoxin [Lactococcus termiticola]GBG97419.1 ferredoxin [Lactococcus termiticola]
MKIKLQIEDCIACGLCHVKAPEIFDYDDSGLVRFYADKEAGEIELKESDGLIEAIKHCPTGAIKATK